MLRLKIGIFDAKLPRAVDEDGIKGRFTYNLTGHPKGDKRIRLYRLIGGKRGAAALARHGPGRTPTKQISEKILKLLGVNKLIILHLMNQ